MPLPPRHFEPVPVCQNCWNIVVGQQQQQQHQQQHAMGFMQQQQQPAMMQPMMQPILMQPHQQPIMMHHPSQQLPMHSPSSAASASSSSAASSAAAASSISFSENLSVLRSLYKEIDAEVARDVLTAQRNNLARAIKFLRGEEPLPSHEEEEKQGEQQRRFPAQAAAANAAAAAAALGQGTVAAVPGAAPAAAAPRPLPAGPSVAAMPPAPVPAPASSLHTIAPDHRLTALQRQFFFAHGFLHLTGAVRAELVSRALGHINESLGRGINQANFHQNEESRARGSSQIQYCADKWNHPAIAALFRDSACPTLVESLLGVGGFTAPSSGQIALTFPNASKFTGGSAAENPAAIAQITQNWNTPASLRKSWHIDGIHRKSSGFAADEIKNFTLLVGIYLSAAPADFCGNITVFPGSHRELEAYFRRVDPIVRLVDDSLPDIPLNPPHQLHVSPGDVLLAHYQTAHAVAPNLSSHVRYAVYFRLIHSARPRWSYSKQCMVHIWTEYAGLKDLYEEQERTRERAEAAAAASEQAARRRVQQAEQEAADLARALELSRIDAQAQAQPMQQQPQPVARAAAPVAAPAAAAAPSASSRPVASPSHVQPPSSSNVLSNPFAPAPR